MNDLNDDAQALFHAARGAHEPTSHDHQRVLRRVLARGAAVASVAGGGVGAAVAKSAVAASRVAAAAKVLAGFALLGAAGAGVYRATSTQRAAPAVAVAAPGGSQQAPFGASGNRLAASEHTVAPLPSATSEVEQPREDQRTIARRAALPPRSSEPASDATDNAGSQGLAARAAPAPAAVASGSFPSLPPQAAASVSPSSVTLTREARALADVQRALREGRSADALSLLAAQSREFAGGVLGQEREAARIVALCSTTSRAAEGRAAAERFLAANVTSPAAAHIRVVCGVPRP